MKKVLFIFIMLCLVLSMISCGSSNLEKEILGEWQIVEASKRIRRANDCYPEEDILFFGGDGCWNHAETNTYRIYYDEYDGAHLVMDSDKLAFQYTYLIGIGENVLEICYPSKSPIFYERVR